MDQRTQTFEVEVVRLTKESTKFLVEVEEHRLRALNELQDPELALRQTIDYFLNTNHNNIAMDCGAWGENWKLYDVPEFLAVGVEGLTKNQTYERYKLDSASPIFNNYSGTISIF